MRKLILLLTLCVPAIAAAQVLDIEVTGIAQPTPVAVVPFGWEGQGAAMPLNVSTVITADLRRSGRFDPVAEEKMLQKPTDGADVDFQDWGFVGVEAVVVGKAAPGLPHAASHPRNDAGCGTSRRRHDLREADGHPGRFRHARGLRHCQATG